MREKADELDQRAMAGEGTEDDAPRVVCDWSGPAYFHDPANRAPGPDVHPARVAGNSQTFEDILALLDAGRPARAARRRTADRWRSSTASAARSRRRSPIETAAAFPQGSATGVPDAGHFSWLEQPGCVADGLVRLGARL